MEKLDKKSIDDIFALTHMQEGMLLHYLRDTESDLFFEQLNLEISGEIDVNIFEKAWNFVVETNEMLRTVLRWEKVENPIQIVLKKHQLYITYYDFSGEEPGEKKKQVEKIKGEDRRKKFDLREIPFRVTLCKVEKDRYHMIISNHHILYDGWSSGIILNEFLHAYDACSGQKLPTRPNKGKFKEFVKWIRNHMTEKLERYWQEYLQDFTGPIIFPGKFKKKENFDCIGNYHFIFPDQITSQLDAFLKARKIPLSALIYSAWGILLHKYNYCEDIIFDTTVSGRSAKIHGIENIVGLFINTVPCRIKTHAKQKIKDLLFQVNKMMQERKEYELASLVNTERYSYHNSHAFFDSLLVIENYPLTIPANQKSKHELSLTSFSIDEITRYDITVVITTFNGIDIRLTYQRSLFDKYAIETLVNGLVRILEEIVASPERVVSQINLLSEEEKTRVLLDLNVPGREYQWYKKPVYLLDKYHQPVPPGFIGEVFAAGIEIKGSDFNHLERIENPFLEGQQVARTGELARLNSNGTITYMGRLDNKIRINNRLIDPVKIETLILSFGSINDVKVIEQQKGEDETDLYAYMVCDTEIPTAQLKQYLQKKLDPDMVPRHFVKIERIPLKANGKVDRKKLSVLLLEHEKNGRQNTSPATFLEQKLCMIWAEVFHVDYTAVGVNSNFLEFGGHSLKAKVLIMKINEELKVRVPLEKVFKLLTIRKIAQFIQESVVAQNCSLFKPVEKREYYELSSAQKRFYVLHQMDKENVTFNMPNVFHLEGKIDRKKVENAFSLLIHHHETLRTSIHFKDGEPHQRIKENTTFQVEYSECSETEISRKIEDFVQPFQLNIAPLLRVHLIRVKEENMYLLVDIHHIISDGFSIEILMEDFTFLYHGKKLEPLGIQYKDYAFWHNKLLKNKNLLKQEDYWIKQLDGFKFTQLPVDTIRSYNQAQGKCERQKISQVLLVKIHDFCAKHRLAQFVFLMAVFSIVLEMEIDQQDITMGTPFMNRDQKDLHRLIGVFLNVLLIRSSIDKNDTFLNYLRLCKKIVIEAFANSAYPYELLVERLRQSHNWKRDELFTILFNYFAVEKNIQQLSVQYKISHIDYQTVLPKYDLTLYVTEFPDCIRLELVYKANLFSEQRIKRILEHFLTVLEKVLENAEMRLSQLIINNDCVLGDIEPGIDLCENDIFLNL